MKKLMALIVGGLLAVTLGFGVAHAVTPQGIQTSGDLQVQTVHDKYYLTETYTGYTAYCPDGWVAVAGGFYMDAPYHLVDDISIRASQRNENSNGQGWMTSAKWDDAISGEHRRLVAEATCVKAD